MLNEGFLKIRNRIGEKTWIRPDPDTKHRRTYGFYWYRYRIKICVCSCTLHRPDYSYFFQ